MGISKTSCISFHFLYFAINLAHYYTFYGYFCCEHLFWNTLYNTKIFYHLPSSQESFHHFLTGKSYIPTAVLQNSSFCNIASLSIEKKCNAWFTFSLRQHETRQEWWCEGYIRFIFHALDLFSSRLVALGHKCLASLLKLHSTSSRSSRTRVWMSTFVHTSSHSHLAKSLDEYPRRDCKPGIMMAES